MLICSDRFMIRGNVMRLVFGIVFSLLWSSAFIAGKYCLEYLPPLDVLSLRFLLAAALLFALCWWVKRSGQGGSGLADKRLWLHGMALGMLNYVLYLGFSYTGLQTIPPELVVLLVSTMPFVTTLAVSCVKRKWSWLQWLAISLGFLGVYIVLSVRMPETGWSIGIAWVVLGMLALAGGTLFYQFTASRHQALPLTGIQNLFGGLILLPFSNPMQWPAAMAEPVFVLSLWYQVVVVSGVAMVMWFQLVRWFGSDNASAFHLLNPIFAAVLAWWFFGSDLGMADAAGTVLVVLALGMLNRLRRKV